METIYQKRMQPIWAQLTRGRTQEERNFNIKLILNSRKGDYLIKSQDKYDCISGCGYIDFSFKNTGWYCASIRKNAQWFSKEEAKELIKKYPKFKIVRK